MKNKLYLIAGIICYLAAIAFFVSAIIGKSTIFLTLGVLWICIGNLDLLNLDLLLSRKRKGNKK